MEEKKQVSHYERYKDSIIAARNRWVEANREKMYDSIRYRNQLYKFAYYKLKELVEQGVLNQSVLDDVKQKTDDNVEKLKNRN